VVAGCDYYRAPYYSGRLAGSQIAAEFVRLNVDIIVTSGTPQVLAVKQRGFSLRHGLEQWLSLGLKITLTWAFLASTIKSDGVGCFISLPSMKGYVWLKKACSWIRSVSCDGPRVLRKRQSGCDG
jgi:hypothetical protein